MAVVLSPSSSRRIARAVRRIERMPSGSVGSSIRRVSTTAAAAPYRVEMYKSSATAYAYTVHDALAQWWSSDNDNYVPILLEETDGTFTRPAIGKTICLYAKLTVSSDSSVALTFAVTADNDNAANAITEALSESNGTSGTVRILPLLLVDGYELVTVLHRGVWYIGRES